MGVDTIPTRADATTITATWFNLFKSVLDGDFVPRNASGVATAVAASLGSATYPWLSLFIGAAASGLSIVENSGEVAIKVAGSIVGRFTTTGLRRDSIQGINRTASASSGATQTESTGTFTDIVHLTRTFVATGYPVRIDIIPQGDGTTSSIDLNVGAAASADGYFRVLRDAVVIGKWYILSASGNMSIPPNLSVIDEGASGAVTYKLQFAAATSGLSRSVGISNAVLLVTEQQ